MDEPQKHCNIWKTPDSKDHIIPFIGYSGIGRTIGRENRSAVARCWTWGEGHREKLLGVMDLSYSLFVEVAVTDYMHLSNFTEVYTKKGPFYCWLIITFKK